jgi:cysteinyl-tRNA synthetase
MVYCCGPTVYHFQHLGNLRTYIFEDLLIKTLKAVGHQVKHIMNITDVGHLVGDGDSGEDKMMVAARREGKKSLEIAEFYTGHFFQDCHRLGISKPDQICKATEHIQQMIELIKELEAKGATYIAGGNVYFDISIAKDYGKLAKLELNKLDAGARIEVDQNKRSPFDFVLWFTKSKFSNQELLWESPWGVGYPGWHIECSAMARHYLGDSFDIHCGGIDHIPVHHTNEIAQSETASGKQFARFWMHGGFLVNEKNEKMAKSSGEFLCVKQLDDKRIEPLAFRYFTYGTHYRNQLSFNWEALHGAQSAFNRLQRNVEEWREESAKDSDVKLREVATKWLDNAYQVLTNDLNMPQLLGLIWELVDSKNINPNEKLNLLEKIDQVTSLGVIDWRKQEIELPPEIKQIVAERDKARKEKRWKDSDLLRQQLIDEGYHVEDSSKGTLLKRR